VIAVAAGAPQQTVARGRVESAIALAAPLLDLVLTVGDRVSRLVGPDDEYYPIRSGGEEPLPLAESDSALPDA